MSGALMLHPDSRCEAATFIEVFAARKDERRLELDYVVTGNMQGIRLPNAGIARRGDNLWQKTCFEVFIRPRGGKAYYEFNFTPASEWAAYGFDGYRRGMRALDLADAPHIGSKSDAARFSLSASLDLRGLTELPGESIWDLGLSAVIEETSGNKSYWALAHAPGKPDFHRSDCFALELGAMAQK